MSKAELHRDVNATFPAISRSWANRKLCRARGPVAGSCTPIACSRFRVEDGVSGKRSRSGVQLGHAGTLSAQIAISRLFEVAFCLPLCVIWNER